MKYCPVYCIAGAVNNLLSTAAQRMELRTKHLTVQERAQLTKPAPEDLYPDSARTKKSPESIFEGLIGCKQVCCCSRTCQEAGTSTWRAL
jgi:hypothetical protein